RCPRTSIYRSTRPTPPRLTLFPYTTLFRSPMIPGHRADEVLDDLALDIDEGGDLLRILPLQIGQQPLERKNAEKIATFIDVERRSEEHTSELQSLTNLVCRLLLEKKKQRHV